MFGKDLASSGSGSPAESLETGASRFPVQPVSEDARRHKEPGNISGNVERLNHVLRIVPASRIAPATQLDVQFAVVLVAGPFVERGHAENGCGRQVSGLPDRHHIGAVPQTAIENHLSTGPPV